MKQIVTILLLIACGLQVNAQYTPNSGAYQYKGLKMLNSFQPPSGTGDPVTSVNAPDNNSPAWYYNKTDTTWYQFNPVSKVWSPFVGGGGAARLRAAWNKRQYVIGESSADNPEDGATTVVLPFAVQQHSELITYQGVPVPLYPSEDFWYNVTYDSTATTYTFRDPLTEGYALNFQYAEADSIDGGGGGSGSSGDADSLGGLPASAYEKVSNKSTTTTLGTSNILYPTQNAVKTYTDNGLLNKVDKTTEINTASPLAGGDALDGSLSLSISQAGTLTDGYLSSTDWNTFNNKVGVTSPVNGNIPYYNSGWQKLATGTAKQSLHPNGSGGYVWRDTVAVASSDLSYHALTYGDTTTVNYNTATKYVITLTGNTTFAFSNFVDGGTVIVYVIQGSGGGKEITMPAGTVFPTGTATGLKPNLSTAAGAADKLSITKNNITGKYEVELAKAYQ